MLDVAKLICARVLLANEPNGSREFVCVCVWETNTNAYTYTVANGMRLQDSAQLSLQLQAGQAG